MNIQSRVSRWVIKCLGAHHFNHKKERAFRFAEESFELLQAAGVTPEELHQLIVYTYSRPVGVLHEEMGQVLLTLYAMAESNRIDLDNECETAVEFCWENFEKIRKKANSKPFLPAGPVPQS